MGATAVVIVGLIIANILANLIHRLVIWSRVDHALRSTNASTGNIDKQTVKFRMADIASLIVRWAVILLTVAIAANILGWTQVTEFMESIVAYLPNIAAAILLLIGGYLLGNFVAGLVSGMNDSLGRRTANVLSNVARWAIIVFAAMAALIQLGIAESIIQIAFIGLTAMLALAGGLAFGLGGRDKAHDLLSEVGPRRAMTA